MASIRQHFVLLFVHLLYIWGQVSFFLVATCGKNQQMKGSERLSLIRIESRSNIMLRVLCSRD